MQKVCLEYLLGDESEMVELVLKTAEEVSNIDLTTVFLKSQARVREFDCNFNWGTLTLHRRSQGVVWRC